MTRFLVFCCSLVKLLAPRVDDCVVRVVVAVGAVVSDDLDPVSFLVPFSDEEDRSGFRLLGFCEEEE